MTARRRRYFVPFVQEALAKSGKSAEEHLDEFCAFVEAQGCRIKSDLLEASAPVRKSVDGAEVDATT